MWLAAGPSDLLGEGGRVGVFVILDGSGAIFTIVVEVFEYRDENVLALCLDGEGAAGFLFGTRDEGQHSDECKTLC